MKVGHEVDIVLTVTLNVDSDDVNVDPLLLAEALTDVFNDCVSSDDLDNLREAGFDVVSVIPGEQLDEAHDVEDEAEDDEEDEED